MTGKELYGQTYERSSPATQSMLDDAAKTYSMAERASTPHIADRALTLAANKENAAFAIAA